MVKPTGADDADSKTFSNLVWFQRGITPLVLNSPAVSTTEPLPTSMIKENLQKNGNRQRTKKQSIEIT